MVATVDGVRLASAPVWEAGIGLTARELAGMLGTPLNTDVHDRASHAECMILGTPTKEEQSGNA